MRPALDVTTRLNIQWRRRNLGPHSLCVYWRAPITSTVHEKSTRSSALTYKSNCPEHSRASDVTHSCRFRHHNSLTVHCKLTNLVPNQVYSIVQRASKKCKGISTILFQRTADAWSLLMLIFSLMTVGIFILLFAKLAETYEKKRRPPSIPPTWAYSTKYTYLHTAP